jgi:hypothetical protein
MSDTVIRTDYDWNENREFVNILWRKDGNGNGLLLLGFILGDVLKSL